MAGSHRLKWCVALEQVVLGAFLSVLLAVGLELLSALAFGGELRSCSPPPNTRAPFAAAGAPVADIQSQQPSAAASGQPAGGAPISRSIFSAVVEGFLDPQLTSCGVGSRGVYGHLNSYIAGGAPRAVGEATDLKAPVDSADTAANPYICVGFIFACQSFS